MKKNKRSLFVGMMMLCLSILITPLTAKAAVIPVEKIEIGGNDLLAVGNSCTYTCKVTPKNAPSKVFWSVSPENCGVTISAAGKVVVTSDVSVDKVIITAKSQGNESIYDTKEICINKSGINSLTLLDEDGNSIAGKKRYLCKTKVNENTKTSLDILPKITLKNPESEIKFQPYKFTSSNENIVTVDNNGHVQATGNALGKATITCSLIDGSKGAGNASLDKKITVQVIEPITEVNITGNSLVATGKSATYVAKTNPVKPTLPGVTWKVIPENQGAKIDGYGKLIVAATCKLDKVDVVATAKNNADVFSKKTVLINHTTVKTLTLKDEAGNLIEGKTVQLFRNKPCEETPTELYIKPEITWSNPVLADNAQVYYTYTNSNPKFVNVDSDGHVTLTNNRATTEDLAVITCVAHSGGTNVSKNFTVKAMDAITEIYISLPAHRSNYMVKGQTLQLNAVRLYDESLKALNRKGLVYTSSNPSVATVTAKGLVKMLADSYSKVTITVAANDKSGVKASIDLYGTNAITDMLMGDYPSNKANKKYKYYLNLGNEEAFALKFNGPNEGSANVKTVCPDMEITSSDPEIIEARYESGIVYLKPLKSSETKDVTITIQSMDGTKFARTWTFRVLDSEDILNTQMLKIDNADIFDLEMLLETEDIEEVVSEEIIEDDEESNSIIDVEELSEEDSEESSEEKVDNVEDEEIVEENN